MERKTGLFKVLLQYSIFGLFGSRIALLRLFIKDKILILHWIQDKYSSKRRKSLSEKNFLGVVHRF